MSSATVRSPLETPPVEVVAQFFSGLNEPRPTTLGFSFDGLYAASSHLDDAVRIVDVGTLRHSETIRCNMCGISSALFTQSSCVLCVVPRIPVDGHLYLLNLETAKFCGAMAYLNDYEEPLAPSQMPVYSAVTQCPTTDVIGTVISARGVLALFHPLMSGAVAVTKDRIVKGGKPCVSFSKDGNTILVGGDDRVSVLDRRMLFSNPVTVLDHSEIFNEVPTKCRGIEVSADSNRVLFTSSKGETNIFNLGTKQMECTYYHHDAKMLFSGATNNVSSRFVNPYVPASRVVQMTSSMSEGRHLLVYQPNPMQLASHDDSRVVSEGKLEFQFQSKDSEVPVAIAVNPRFQLVATAARHTNAGILFSGGPRRMFVNCSIGAIWLMFLLFLRSPLSFQFIKAAMNIIQYQLDIIDTLRFPKNHSSIEKMRAYMFLAVYIVGFLALVGSVFHYISGLLTTMLIQIIEVLFALAYAFNLNDYVEKNMDAMQCERSCNPLLDAYMATRVLQIIQVFYMGSYPILAVLIPAFAFVCWKVSKGQLHVDATNLWSKIHQKEFLSYILMGMEISILSIIFLLAVAFEDVTKKVLDSTAMRYSKSNISTTSPIRSSNELILIVTLIIKNIENNNSNGITTLFFFCFVLFLFLCFPLHHPRFRDELLKKGIPIEAVQHIPACHGAGPKDYAATEPTSSTRTSRPAMVHTTRRTAKSLVPQNLRTAQSKIVAHLHSPEEIRLKPRSPGLWPQQLGHLRKHFSGVCRGLPFVLPFALPFPGRKKNGGVAYLQPLEKTKSGDLLASASSCNAGFAKRKVYSSQVKNILNGTRQQTPPAKAGWKIEGRRRFLRIVCTPYGKDKVTSQ
eukprot:gene2019-1209_t